MNNKTNPTAEPAPVPLYMNNNGDRVTYREKAPREFYERQDDGTHTKRTADYFESFGNFAVTCYRKNGKRFAAFAESFETHEGRPVVIASKAAEQKPPTETEDGAKIGDRVAVTASRYTFNEAELLAVGKASHLVKFDNGTTARVKACKVSKRHG